MSCNIACCVVFYAHASGKIPETTHGLALHRQFSQTEVLILGFKAILFCAAIDQQLQL